MLGLRNTFSAAKEYGRTDLGIQFFSPEDHLYNYDPYPEKRVSDDAQEEDQIIAQFAKDTLPKIQESDLEGVWYASGWALFNPRWRQETAEAFFQVIGKNKFYIADTWGESHPIHKRYQYFYGHDWVFGILHSFGGDTSLHGNVADLIQKVKRLVSDPEASNCLGLYINPEVIIYNDFYFDLAARLSWIPQDVQLDDFIFDYAERRYGTISAPLMAQVYQELVASVYSTDDRISPFWQSRMGTDFPANLPDRLSYITHLERALKIALTQIDCQENNDLYQKDLVMIAKQLVGEVFNGYSLRLYNAFQWKDKETLQESASVMRSCLDIVASLIESRKEYWLKPVLDHIYQYPAMTDDRKKNVEYYFKDSFLSFALRDNLRDYNRRDIVEMFHLYHRPRVEAYLNYLEEKVLDGNFEFSKKEIEPIYCSIEESWMKTPIFSFSSKIENQHAIPLVEEVLDQIQSVSKAIIPDITSDIRNGGFEEGSGKLTGWQIAIQNVDVFIRPTSEIKKKQESTGNPEGMALYFSADTQNRYKTFSVQQKVLWTSDSRISVRYKIEKSSPTGNANLKIIGHDGTGQSRLQLLYYWGGDSWDRKNEGPETGGLYTAAYQFEAPKGSWQEIDRDPVQDLDRIHETGVWNSLEIETLTLALGIWVYEENKNFIEGWFDEIRMYPNKENEEF